MGRATLDVNADVGESFGRWRLGNDEELVPLVSSANVACGFHAGDPSTMRATVRLAAAHGVAVGAHVGLPDLVGFGRRAMAVSAEEVRDYAAYQIGALAAVCAAEGAELAHVKPHGALYATCSRDPEQAASLAEAIAGIDRSLLLLLLDRSTAPAVEAHGVRLVSEAFVDLEYDPEGALRLEPSKRAWDPSRVARRAVRVAREGRIDAVDGSAIAVDAPTVCLHGDAPNAVAVAAAVRRALADAGVDVRPLAAALAS